MEGNKKDASEIARAIDLLLSRVQQLESHQDSADAERSDAASIDVMVDAKILAVARKVEALDSAVERLAVRLQPFELCVRTCMSLLNPVSNLFCCDHMAVPSNESALLCRQVMPSRGGYERLVEAAGSPGAGGVGAALEQTGERRQPPSVRKPKCDFRALREP